MSKYDDIFLSTETIQDFIDKNNIKNSKNMYGSYCRNLSLQRGLK